MCILYFVSSGGSDIGDIKGDWVRWDKKLEMLLI